MAILIYTNLRVYYMVNLKRNDICKWVKMQESLDRSAIPEEKERKKKREIFVTLFDFGEQNSRIQNKQTHTYTTSETNKTYRKQHNVCYIIAYIYMAKQHGTHETQQISTSTNNIISTFKRYIPYGDNESSKSRVSTIIYYIIKKYMCWFFFMFYIIHTHGHTIIVNVYIRIHIYFVIYTIWSTW